MESEIVCGIRTLTIYPTPMDFFNHDDFICVWDDTCTLILV